jgi:hypothetical protein
VPGGDDWDFDSEPTAKTLRLRAVCFDPHLGHSTLAGDDIDFTSFSKLFLQDLQVYS